MLVLPDTTQQQLHAHASAVAPLEGCGIVGGQWARQDAHVRTVRRMENVATHPDHRYRIAPEALHEAITELNAADHELLGFYHTHPEGPLHPSETDRELAQWPGYLYLIVVPSQSPTITAWEWNGTAFDRQQIRESKR